MRAITAASKSASLLLAALASACAGADSRSIVRIEVMPRAARVSGPEPRQQLLVTGVRADGSLIDLTDLATVDSADSRVVRASVGSLLLGVRPGRTVVTVRARGRSASVPVVVERGAHVWSFANHVESALSREGCNTGPCHGAGSGKGGFRLSLRAYDPEADYGRICREGRGRRVVKTDPALSLLLAKPSLVLAHQGGLKLRRGSLEYRVVAGWIASGAPPPRASDPRLISLEVHPAERILPTGARQRLQVTARFSDGHSEDVTHWAKYSSNDEPVARVDESGRVTMRGYGETAISVWYLGRVAFARVAAPFPNRIDPSAYARLPVNGRIDALIHAQLRRMHLFPSPPATDAEFIRRASLDAIGALPTASETRSFTADRSLNKRERLIDSLLDRPEYVDYWTYRFSDLLRVNRSLLGDKGMWMLYAWLKGGVASNRSWGVTARELLTASGNAARFGPANFYRLGQRPEEFAENISQAFLGIRVQCAKCHNHPFEKWTQSDYYRMASFFSRIGRKDDAEGGTLIFVKDQGEIDHPRLGRPLAPAAFDGPSLALQAPGDRRAFLAKWMTSPENPYFARTLVNRVWKHFMGRGLVEPVDDMRLTNPPSNAPLMDWLALDFARSGFDVKRLIRQIMASQAYQASSRPNVTNTRDDRFYARYLPRRMPAETLLDAVGQVTGRREKFAGMPPGIRAISLPDTTVKSSFLDLFGRPARQVTCECERNHEPNVAQALHLISADTLNARVLAKGGSTNQMLDSGKTDLQILDDLYLSALSRRPTRAESAAVLRDLAQDAAASVDPMKRREARARVFADLLWALLNGAEFQFNH